MKTVVEVYNNTRKLGDICVELACGDLFCDRCGDCIDCCADECYDGARTNSSHWFLVYSDDNRFFVDSYGRND